MTRNVDLESSNVPCIAVSLSDQQASRCVTSLLQSDGFAVSCLTSHELACWDCREVLQALVYDLHPWDMSAADAVTHILQTVLGPILLYVPPMPGVGRVLEAWARDARVSILFQLDVEYDSARLRIELDRLRSRIFCEQVGLSIEAGLPHMSERASSFMYLALREVGNVSRAHPPTVSSVASRMNVGVRTLERNLPADGLPHPKEFINWLTLLYASFAADFSALSFCDIARMRGWHPGDLYRLRHRLMKQSGVSEVVTRESASRGDFPRSLSLFLRRCGAPIIDFPPDAA